MAESEVAGASSKQTDTASHEPQTAAEYINSQLLLEEEAREALPYAFDTCTRPFGPLRQSLFSCLTCNPPTTFPSEPYNAAGICYSCSISCHGEHTLVELFNKRNFVCDCGTTRLPSASPCKLRIDPKTGTKGVHSETPEEGNHYDHNFRNRFCGCEIEYNAFQEKGTMFQCIGLGSVEDGGCGEDWYHPGCLVGLGRDWYENSGQQMTPKPTQADQIEGAPNSPDGVGDSEEPPLPPGFPKEDEFDTFICYKCVAANPWIARYAGTDGFLPAVYKRDAERLEGTDDEGARKPNDVDARDNILEIADADISKTTLPNRSAQDGLSKKRKAEGEPEESSKKPRSSTPSTDAAATTCRCPALVPNLSQSLSLFLKPTFRDHLCHCPACFPLLTPYPALLEEELIYEPPLSASSQHTSAAGSVHNSLLERGERALNNIDRVRAIEGAMAFNTLKEKVKSFLKPFAETGKVVGAEDIKNYFEELRGDSQAVRDAAAAATAAAAGSSGDNRKGQSGLFCFTPI
ncbi:MAG: hypothetical protein M1840_007015 [Geoglossum simile]|nr:MAG: hypothetical protein M1840_007015 [Geoglossum simile]